jgi:CSLREA domain-containing protein
MATGLIAAFLCNAAQAKTFTVNFLVDATDLVPGDGACNAGGGICTLRAAIMEANEFVDATPNVIKIPGSVDIKLSLTSGDDDPAFGDLNVLADLRIVGEGPLATTIEGTGTERVFDVEATLEISNVTIRGGRATGTPGGGIRVRDGGDLTCRNCWILDNRSTTHGGGVYVEPAGLATLEDSRIAGNMTSGGGGCGGGLAVRGAMTVQRSLVESNRAHGNFFTQSWGGGICSFFGSAISIRESAIVGNEVDGGSENYGGGIAFVNGTWDLLNVTISGNRATSAGGGMAMVFNTTTALNNVTVAGNTAHDGGGFAAIEGATTPLVAANSIFADNSAVGDGPDCQGVISSGSGHNLLEDVNDCSFTGTTTSNQLAVDPQLLPLGGYGGATPTHELSSTSSPAFAGGSNASCETFDQRGVARPRGTCEMGATEFVGVIPLAGQWDGSFGLNQYTLHFEPTWGNISPNDAAVTGAALSITSPGAPPNVALSIPDAAASYGTIGSGFFASCLSTGNCYDIAAVADSRPAQHWDVVVTEKTASLPLSVPWVLHLPNNFADADADGIVPDVETTFHAGVMRGCRPGAFCGRDPVSRGQVAMHLERARRGPDYPPLDATGVMFSDVPAGDPRAPWIELFAQDGLSAGCGPDPDGGGGPLDPPFCPDGPMSRQAAAVLFLKSTQGPGFVPIACVAGSERFSDVPASSPHCPWIEELARRNVTQGCALDVDGPGPLQGKYCPLGPLSRYQLASFLTRAYDYPWVTF